MAIEVSSSTVVCPKCGKAYGKRRGYFLVSYAMLHKGIQYIPVCKECIDELYNGYLAQCHNAKDAVRQMCRKLDLYWNETIFRIVDKMNTPRSIMTSYIAKINIPTYAGKCYDDSLSDEGTLWSFGREELAASSEAASDPEGGSADAEEEKEIPITKEVKDFWGPGVRRDMYRNLEDRRRYWMKRFSDEGIELDIGTEALLRQICILEITINQDSAAGRAIDKNVNAYNSLLGSASLKPTQKKEEASEDAALASTPLGVWLYRYEQKRPLPEVDDDMKDVNGIRKYVFTWMGHLCKMLGLKNGYTELYENEVAKLRVERPEYDGEDDEAFMSRIFEEGDDGDEESDDEDEI